MRFWAPALALIVAACATAPPPRPASVAPEVTELRNELAGAVAHELAPGPPPRVDIEAAVSMPIPRHASIQSALALFRSELKSDVQDSLIR